MLWTLVLSMALPAIVTVIPLYHTLRTLQLLDTIAGLTLVMSSALAPFTVWVLVAFIQQVPYEIEEAAITAAREVLTGRRIIDVEGPYGLGVTSVEVGNDDICREPAPHEASVLKIRTDKQIALLEAKRADLTLSLRELRRLSADLASHLRRARRQQG